jgi:hypothetical protein
MGDKTMKTEDMLILGAIAIGAFYLYSKLGKPIADAVGAVESPGSALANAIGGPDAKSLVPSTWNPLDWITLQAPVEQLATKAIGAEVGKIYDITSENHRQDAAGLANTVSKAPGTITGLFNYAIGNTPGRKTSPMSSAPALKAIQTVINPKTGHTITVSVSQSLHGFINPKTGFHYSGR